MWNRKWSWGAVAILGVGAVGCEYEFSTERHVPARGTLGEEVYKIVLDEAAHSARDQQARVGRVEAQKDDFITAVDNVLPPAMHDPVQKLLTSMLPLYDEDIFSRTTRSVASLLGDMALDNAYLTAAVRGDLKKNYLPGGRSLVQHIVSFPSLREQLSDFVKMALAYDGRGEDGRLNDEAATLANMVGVASRRLKEYTASADPERTAYLFADLLLKEDDRVARPGLAPMLAARPDSRGIARVRINAATGKVYAPFVDGDNDGLADVNAAGQFVGADGQPIALEPFGASTADGITRSADGRALAADGKAVFDYVDLNKTLAGALFDDTHALIGKELLFKAAKTIPVVMGQRVSARGPNGRAFNAFGASDAPLLDLVHALMAAADIPDLSKLLTGAKKIIDTKPDAIAGAVRELKRLHAVAEAHAEALGERGNTLLDDLKPILVEIIETDGLLQALLEGLVTPIAEDSDRGMLLQLKYKKDRVTIAETNAGQAAVYNTLVDRTRPDTNQNRSLFMRTLHLLYDTYKVSFAPKVFNRFDAGALITIPDLAIFYLDSVAGNARVSSMVSTITRLLGTPLAERPTPEQVNRFINTPNALMSEPVGRDGVLVREYHGDALLALEAAGLQKSLKPIVKPFSDRGKTEVLVKFFVTLYKHWASPQSNYQSSDPAQPMWSKRSGIVRYEPVLIELWSSPFMPRLRAFAKEALRTEVDGIKFTTLLERAARKLFKGDALLKTRDNRVELTHENGVRVTPLTPFDLIRNAVSKIDRAFANNASAKALWLDMRTAVQDLYLEIDESSGAPKLKNQTGIVFLSHALEKLAERIRIHERTPGEMSRRLKSVYADTEEILTGYDFATIFDALTLIDGRAETKIYTQDLLKHILLKTGDGRDALLRSTAIMFFTMLDGAVIQPVARFWGNALDPDRDLLWKLLDFQKRVDALDTEGTFIKLLRSGFEPSVRGETPFGILGNVIRDVHRVNPAETGALSEADHRSVLGGAYEYLLDTKHGVEKLIEITKNRK
ncbi:MAG: hypothetical protein HYY84_07990 [Deltaproteobacteria bacterium]|nr:hypothetical protein [Deltaproteobacteria bacterium]